MLRGNGEAARAIARTRRQSIYQRHRITAKPTNQIANRIGGSRFAPFDEPNPTVEESIDNGVNGWLICSTATDTCGCTTGADNGQLK